MIGANFEATELSPASSANILLRSAAELFESYHINPTGNPRMASGGMGDVLSGIIGALLAQGATADRAMLAGVYLHGAAADDAVSQGKGPIGLTASEVIACAREHVNRHD